LETRMDAWGGSGYVIVIEMGFERNLGVKGI
jgi:hypothetical protein